MSRGIVLRRVLGRALALVAILLLAAEARPEAQADPATRVRSAGFEVDLSLANTRLQPQAITLGRFRLAQNGVHGPYRQLVFALDVSESMAGAPLVALRQAVQSMVADLDRLTGLPLEVGVLAFARTPAASCGPTTDRQRLVRCLADLTTGRGSGLAAGLTAAAELLTPETTEPPLAGTMLVLVADGTNEGGCEPLLAAARRARADGATVGTVALGDAADSGCLAQAASAEAAAKSLRTGELEAALAGFVPLFGGPRVGAVSLKLVLPSHLRYVADSADLVPRQAADQAVSWALEGLPLGGVELHFALAAVGTGRGVPLVSAEVNVAGVGPRTVTAVGPVVSVGAPPPCACPPVGSFVPGEARQASARYPLMVGGAGGCEPGGDPEPVAWWRFEHCGSAPTALTLLVTATVGSRVAVYQPDLDPDAACRSALASGPADQPLQGVIQPGPFAVAVFGPAAAQGAEPPELDLVLACAAKKADDGMGAIDVWTMVYGAEVFGRLPFREPVAGVLRGADGRQKAQTEEVYLDADGAFRLAFADDGLAPAPVPILPGDRVVLTPSGGRPLEIAVPWVAATADVAADTVSGSAPPSRAIEVSVVRSWVIGQPAVPVTTAVTTDAQGRFTASFAGRADLLPGSTGRVRVAASDGRHFVFEWSAPSLALNVDALGRLELAGTGAYLRPVQADLVSSDARWLGGGTGRVTSPGSPGEWRLPLVDRSGAAVGTMAGDRLAVRVGDDLVNVAVPPLSAEVDLASGVLGGRAAPGARLTVHGPGFAAATSADAAGQLRLDLTPWHRYRRLEAVAADLWQGGHRFTAGRVPGIQLALRSGCVSGLVQPLGSVSVTQTDAGGRPASPSPFRTKAAADGSFALCPSRPPAAGDAIDVQVAGAVVNPTHTLTVPAFDLALSAVDGTVSGQASGSGELGIDLIGPRGFDRQLIASRSLTLANGAPFALALGQAPYASGTMASARFRLPSGNLITVTTATPSLRFEHGGNRICGSGRPGEAVTATLERADGAVLAEAAGRVDEDALYRLALTDAAGRPVALEAGHSLRLRLSSQPLFVPLAPMRLDVDFTTGLLTGQLPPRSPYGVTLRPEGCPGRLVTGEQAGAWRPPFVDAADAEGRFGQRLTDPLAPGEGLAVHVPLATGGLAYRRAVRPLAIVRPGEATPSGLASPGTHVAATLLGHAGQALAGGEADVDPEGRYSLTLLDVNRRAAPIRPSASLGPSLLVTASGEAFLMPLDPFTATFRADTGLVASAPPSRTLLMRLTLRAGGAEPRVDYGGRPLPSPLVIRLMTDASGRAAFTALDLPPRGGWTLDDVEGADLALVTPRGDELRQALVVPAAGNRVFLPRASNR